MTNKNESVQDITLQYVDVESHKAALATEQQRLLELLEQADAYHKQSKKGRTA